MAEEPRARRSGAATGPAAPFIRTQPKGVVGNIVPWNFPFDLSVGPLVEMLAAGNRVIIKPSDYTPACGELLRRDDRADVRPRPRRGVGRRPRAGAGVPALRWDHLLYTGSPAIGREIAKAAAENLVPVTLELGGKCPAILTADSVDAESRAQVLGTKLIKNGQMCISVDYVPGPARAGRATSSRTRGQYVRERAAGLLRLGRLHRDHHRAPPASGSQRLLDEARAAGARVRRARRRRATAATRRLPLALVIDPPERPAHHAGGDLRPDPAGHAVRRPSTRRSAVVNAGERPLGLYVYSKDAAGRRATCCGRRHPAARASTSARVQGALPSLRLRRDRAERQRAGTTASRASASSPTRAAWSSAARATWSTRSCRRTGRRRRPSWTACSTARRNRRAAAPGSG